MSTATKQRLHDLKRFYAILEILSGKTNGARLLSECAGRMNWPERGVYFFRETGEERTDTGAGLRVVRVGTHALKDGAKTSLWNRLSQHRGVTKTGGGNHRGSIFRGLVGTALMDVHGISCPTWLIKHTAPRDITEKEKPLEILVSKTIGAMPFLWLAITDQPGPNSLRGYVERNAIALLSNDHKPPIDAASSRWLGKHCDRERVRNSDIWNQNHVDEDYDPNFLDELEALTLQMKQV